MVEVATGGGSYILPMVLKVPYIVNSQYPECQPPQSFSLLGQYQAVQSFSLLGQYQTEQSVLPRRSLSGQYSRARMVQMRQLTCW